MVILTRLELNGIVSKTDGEKYVFFCTDGGLTATRSVERQIEAAVSKGEYRECSFSEYKEPADMSEIKRIYNQGLMSQAPDGLCGISCKFECDNERIKSVAEQCLAESGGKSDGDLIFRISKDGRKLTADSHQVTAEYHSLLALCCLDEMRKGRDVAVPYDAPQFLDSLAEEWGKKVLRYLSTPADSSDLRARQLAAKQPFVRDGLFLAVKILAMMKEKNCTLADLLSVLPKKFILKKTVRISFSPSYLISVAGENSLGVRNDFEGVKILRDNGRVLIIPERGGETVRILAESNSMEAAQELCADVEDIINSVSDKV